MQPTIGELGFKAILVGGDFVKRIFAGRTRSLKQGKRCVPGLEAVVTADYHDYGREEAVIFLLFIDSKRVKRAMLEKELMDWKNVPSKRAAYAAGLL